jgi:hypothetical protein
MKQKLYNIKNSNKQTEALRQTVERSPADTSIVQKVGTTDKTEQGIRKIEKLDLEHEASKFEVNGRKFKN